MKRLVLSLAALLCAGVALAVPDGPAHLMRYADLGPDQIVFTYEDDLWLVPAAGGEARRITTGHGTERDAKFSPDGRWLAFTGDYDGGPDVYVMPAAGGEPVRLTFTPGTDQVLDWHPDGEHILFRSNRRNPLGDSEFYLVSRHGGLPEPVPTDRGALASYSPDGDRLAYNRIAREMRTWKRYQGGMAQDIWVADFTTGAITRVTDFAGTDNFPMWHGSEIVFTSDREDGTLNLFAVSPAGGEPRRLTDYADYDVKYPSLGPTGVVFQYAETLHVYDFATGAVRALDVRVHSDRVPMRNERIPAAPRSGSFALSPAGERVLLEARGEILNLPAEEGVWFDLTHTSASREKDAAWSPDGKWIAFISDRTGEEQLYLVDQKGRQKWRQLTHDRHGFLLPPVWSPDSEHILFGDKFMRLNLVDVESGDVTVVDQSGWDDAWERWGIQDYVWSPDGRWIAYSKNTGNMNEVVCLYSLDAGEATQVTDPFFTSWSPSFDPEGRYLWFLSNRTFDPVMGRVDQNHVFLHMARPYLVLLQEGVRSPFLVAEGLVAAADGDEKDEKKDDEAAATRIDLAGLPDRVLAAADVPAANYFRLEATADGCLLLRRDELTFLKYQNVNDRTTETDLVLVGYDLDDREATDLASGLANYHLSADGEKLVYRSRAGYGIVDAGKEFSAGDGAVDLDGVRLHVDREQEYRQIFDEAWRIQRDWFYDPGMHGVDWQAIHDKYARFVPWCGDRGDLRYLIGEMIAELNIGHTYVFGGDTQGSGGDTRTGLLGCDFAADADGRVRIAHILPGESWDPASRSPLDEPGVDVREGDYLLAVDGTPLAAGQNPHALLVDRAGVPVELTVSARADGRDPRTVRVETLTSERSLRYRAWVEHNLAYVTGKTGGRIGYLHLPNMMEAGLVEFARYWYPQYDRRAFIIDERNNGGGFVGDMIIDRLERELWAITQPREGGPGRNPERAFHGPVVVLIDEMTGSNGEYFAEAIKTKGLATLIGVRTWGGAVGIEPHQDLVDGGGTTPPQFGLYGLGGEWLIEGHGVEPDLRVMNDPAAVVRGEDPQLDAAIAHLQEILEQEGGRWRLPDRPSYPDKSKAGESVTE